MKKLTTKEKMLVVKSLGLANGIFMMLLGLFWGLKSGFIFFFLLLVVVGIVLLILLDIYEGRLENKK
ncbi:hypothetical protein HY212_06650 [Candidatus Pacearchaeota archaeon]|nr:hypothetical protein [Candidatus Pacearchaeota archaeon]